MDHRYIVFFIILFGGGWAGPAHSLNSAPENHSSEFEKQKARAFERYKNFYAHQKNIEEQRALRRKEAHRHSQLRKDKAALLEAHRVQFVNERNRTQVKSETSHKHEAELKKRSVERGVVRKSFSQEQKRLRRVREKLAKIPEDDEFGFEQKKKRP